MHGLYTSCENASRGISSFQMIFKGREERGGGRKKIVMERDMTPWKGGDSYLCDYYTL